MSGLDSSSNADPKDPTKTESTKPGLDRSIIYQRTGFTRANVSEACKFEVQGSFLYVGLVSVNIYKSQNSYMG